MNRKTVSLMAEDHLPEGAHRNMAWVETHKAMIRLICGCYWCEECGSLRALPECKGHLRDVQRYAGLLGITA